MRVELHENQQQADITVRIEYPQMSDTVQRVAAAVRAVDNHVRCQADDDAVCFVRVADIYYAESVAKQVFVYTADQVYRCGLPLYQLVAELAAFGFVQVSKSCVLNLNVLVKVKALFNSRMAATLENGEVVQISRTFIPAVKKRLEKMR